MATIAKCRPLVAGHGCGKIFATRQNISFWGGVDPATGMTIDPRHELFDRFITVKFWPFPTEKGRLPHPWFCWNSPNKQQLRRP
jgi:predicted aconitase with swiveling domain